MEHLSNEQILVREIPRLNTIAFEPLAAKYPMLAAFESFIGWIILLIPATAIDFFVDKFSIPPTAYYGLIGIAVLSTLLGYFGAKVKGFALRERDILYKEGLFWKKQTGVSFKRIQHIDISHGPVERHFQIATIKFFTAGGAFADLKISGLNQSDAEALRTHILEKNGLIGNDK
ncbi:PH domain-containing protein [Aliikangiella coralliicola]|uniref:PH domain-containing protein n=1 Tax=Aliikangiella coralliicola TaxID=2592383 RepID=A0A545U4P6_9GAMM|nr:PH domain-containing protein [Aliikangiella coralliicola]TQV84451.1 PH domain-containing protein [Aliikangiella coralliicola]